jgi:hypothetical protein
MALYSRFSGENPIFSFSLQYIAVSLNQDQGCVGTGPKTGPEQQDTGSEPEDGTAKMAGTLRKREQIF